MKGLKTGGRGEGTPNKITKDIREALQIILEAEITELPKTLNKLEPRERIEVVVKLLQFAIPKLKETNQSEEFREQPFFSLPILKVNFLKDVETD